VLKVQAMDILAEHKIFQKNGGIFECPLGFIKVAGPDAPDFLHRLTSQDVKTLKPGQGRKAALLQANAMIISLFTLYHGGDIFLLITDRERAAATAAQLEKLHFAENLEISDITEGMQALSVQGSDVAKRLNEIFTVLPLEEHSIVRAEHASQDVLIAKENDFKPGGFHLFIRKEQMTAIKMKLLTDDLSLLKPELWQLLRLEAGHFSFGQDIGEKNLILEAAASDYVSRDKGCYPGQEVVERVFTYGNVAKKLVGLSFKNDKAPAPQTKVFADGKDVGAIIRSVTFPWSGKTLALAMIKKPFFKVGQKLQLEDSKESAEVFHLPQTFEIEESKT
jgi:folate-binding protein YgfZ